MRPIGRTEIAVLGETVCPLPTGKRIEAAFMQSAPPVSPTRLLHASTFPATSRTPMGCASTFVTRASGWTQTTWAFHFGRSDLSTLQDGPLLSAPIAPHAGGRRVRRGATRHCLPGWYGTSCDTTNPWRTGGPFMVLAVLHLIALVLGTVLAVLCGAHRV